MAGGVADRVILLAIGSRSRDLPDSAARVQHGGNRAGKGLHGAVVENKRGSRHNGGRRLGGCRAHPLARR